MSRRTTLIAYRLVAAIVVLLICGLVGVFLQRRSGGHPTATPTPATRPSTTLPAAPVAPGMMLLREPVDPLSLAVPESWRTLTLEPIALRVALRALAAQHPRLAVPLLAEGMAAQEGAIRIFAMTTSPSFAYVAVSSVATPDAPPIPESVLATVTAALKKLSGVSGTAIRVDLPAGPAIRIQATSLKSGLALAVETDLFQYGDRTVIVQMGMETTVAGQPPLFGQIAQSIRFR